MTESCPDAGPRPYLWLAGRPEVTGQVTCCWPVGQLCTDTPRLGWASLGYL